MHMWLKSILFLLLTTLAWAENPPEQIYDEGVRKGVAYNINCVGSGINCTQSGIMGTINVTGSGTVGIGTTNRFVIQTGSSTTGTPYNINADSNGNVGIGTTLPETKLEVAGGGASFNGNVGIGIRNPVADINFEGNSNRSILVGRVAANNGKDLTITAGGGASGNNNVAGGKLILSGGIGTGSGGSEVDVYTSTPGNVGTADVNPSVKLVVIGNGNVGIGSVGPTTKLDVNGTIKGSSVTTTGSISGGTLSVSGTSLLTGNVGIGTTNLGQKLQIFGDSNIFEVKESGTSNSQIRQNANASAANNTLARWTGAWNSNIVSEMRFAAGADTTNKDDGEIRFHTSNTASELVERVRIDQVGNVGINTWTGGGTYDGTVQAPLHIRKIGASNAIEEIIRITGPGSSGGAKIVFNQASQSYPTWYTGEIGAYYTIGDWGSDMFFKTNTGGTDSGVAEVLRLKANGCVGIGTASPGAKLEVTGNIYPRGGTYLAGDGTSPLASGTCNSNIVVKNGLIISCS